MHTQNTNYKLCHSSSIYILENKGLRDCRAETKDIPSIRSIYVWSPEYKGSLSFGNARGALVVPGTTDLRSTACLDSHNVKSLIGH